MINSRKIEDLHPVVREKAIDFIAACKANGIEILITSTYRDQEAQNALYAQGRTKPGKRVTNAKGGDSFHNWRVAFDIVPLRAGKPVWRTDGPDAALWRRIGQIGRAQGLEWGGDWKFKDMPHFQFTAGLTLQDFKNGKTIKVK